MERTEVLIWAWGFSLASLYFGLENNVGIAIFSSVLGFLSIIYWCLFDKINKHET